MYTVNTVYTKLDSVNFEELYKDKHMSYTSIADLYGVSRNAIRKRMRKSGVKSRTLVEAANEPLKREQSRIAGRKSRQNEASAFEQLSKEYDQLFYAYQVCDFIGIKDGKISFIDHKAYRHRNGRNPVPRKLTLEQEEFKKLAPNYRIYYHDLMPS